MSTSLVLPNRASPIALYDRIVDPLAFIVQLGDDFAGSGMFGCTNKQQGRVLAMAVVAENKSPVELARVYHIMDGKLSMKADAMLAEFRCRGGKHRQIERTDSAAEIELTIDGESQRFRLTWAEAQQESFPWGKEVKGQRALKHNWSTPRGRMQMLWARVCSDGVRAMCPEVVAGYYTPEELDDGEEEVGNKRREAKTPPASSQPAADHTSPASAPAEEGEVVDAEFSVVPESAEPKAVSPPPTSASDPALTGQSQADPQAPWIEDNGPCTQIQVNQITSLIRDLEPDDPELPGKIKAQVQKFGKERLVELSFIEAEGLKKALFVKAQEIWAAKQLQGKPKN